MLQPFLILAQSLGEVIDQGMDSHLGYLIENPVHINSATRGELEELLLLSDFQIESLLDYKAKNGVVLGAAELSLLAGFDRECVEIIRPFITFDIREKLDSDRKLRSEFFMKSSRRVAQDTSLLGSPFDLHLKLKVNYGKYLGAGITLQNDEGEYLFNTGKGPLIDFVSGNISIKDYGIVKSLVVGDFSARFAQGLTAWNAFSLSAAAAPSGMVKHGGGISPYTSSDEGNFFRGAGVTFGLGNISVSAFGSYKRVDARIKDGKYTSLPDDGLHNTPSTLAERRSMGEFVVGGNLCWRFSRVKIELSGICYCYDKMNAVPVRDYNRYRLYDGWWGNCSLGVYGVFRKGRYFGELAVDFGGSTAFLGGAVMRLSEGCEFGIIVRRYSRSYIATYASAFSSISDIANQCGVTLSGVIFPARNLKITVWGDAVHYPWKRYGVDTSSFQMKGSVRGEYTTGKWDMSATTTYRHTNHNDLHRLYMKGDAGYRVEDDTGGRMLSGLYLKAKWAAVYCSIPSSDSSPMLGWMVGLVAKCSFFRERTTLQLGVAWYNCKSWDVRLYNYENDLPYTYSSRLLYGEGGSCYILLKQKFYRNLYLYLKGDDTKVKFGIKYRF